MFSESRIWGTPPSGFTKLSDGGGNLMIVRQEHEREISFDICMKRHGGAAPSGFYGRGPLTTLRLADGENALVRP